MNSIRKIRKIRKIRDLGSTRGAVAMTALAALAFAPQDSLAAGDIGACERVGLAKSGRVTDSLASGAVKEGIAQGASLMLNVMARKSPAFEVAAALGGGVLGGLVTGDGSDPDLHACVNGLAAELAALSDRVEEISVALGENFVLDIARETDGYLRRGLAPIATTARGGATSGDLQVIETTLRAVLDEMMKGYLSKTQRASLNHVPSNADRLLLRKSYLGAFAVLANHYSANAAGRAELFAAGAIDELTLTNHVQNAGVFRVWFDQAVDVLLEDIRAEVLASRVCQTTYVPEYRSPLEQVASIGLIGGDATKVPHIAASLRNDPAHVTTCQLTDLTGEASVEASCRPVTYWFDARDHMMVCRREGHDWSGDLNDSGDPADTPPVLFLDRGNAYGAAGLEQAAGEHYFDGVAERDLLRPDSDWAEGMKMMASAWEGLAPLIDGICLGDTLVAEESDGVLSHGLVSTDCGAAESCVQTPRGAGCVERPDPHGDDAGWELDPWGNGVRVEDGVLDIRAASGVWTDFRTHVMKAELVGGGNCAAVEFTTGELWIQTDLDARVARQADPEQRWIGWRRPASLEGYANAEAREAAIARALEAGVPVEDTLVVWRGMRVHTVVALPRVCWP